MFKKSYLCSYRGSHLQMDYEGKGVMSFEVCITHFLTELHAYIKSTLELTTTIPYTYALCISRKRK